MAGAVPSRFIFAPFVILFVIGDELLKGHVIYFFGVDVGVVVAGFEMVPKGVLIRVTAPAPPADGTINLNAGSPDKSESNHRSGPQFSETVSTCHAM